MTKKALLVSLFLTVFLAPLVSGCESCGEEEAEDEAAAAEEARHGLTAEQAGEVLVKVGDTTITVGQFADRLAEQSPYLRARYNSPERRREFLDNMVRFELMALEAERRGLTDLPEIQRAKKQAMIQQMMKEEFSDRDEISDVTDEQIRTYYEEHRDEFNKPAQVRASHILISNRAKAQQTLNQILQNESDVSFFRDRAKELSEDEATRDRYGDLRFFSRPGEESEAADEGEEGEEASDVPDAVQAAAFEIEDIGDVYPELVETDAGYHIVKLTGRRAALERTLEEARRPIQHRLWREQREGRIDGFLEELREAEDVETNYDVLSDVKIDLGPTAPEGAAPGQPQVAPGGGAPGGGAAAGGGHGGGQAPVEGAAPQGD